MFNVSDTSHSISKSINIVIAKMGTKLTTLGQAQLLVSGKIYLAYNACILPLMWGWTSQVKGGIHATNACNTTFKSRKACFIYKKVDTCMVKNLTLQC